MPNLVLDPVAIEHGPAELLFLRGRVVSFEPVVVRAGQGLARAYFTKQLGPASGVAVDAWVQAWVAGGGDVREAIGMSTTAVSIYEAERPTFLGRLVRANGLYPAQEDVERIEVSIFHEDSDGDQGPIFTEDLAVEEVFFSALQRDGYAGRVPGGYNFRWRLPEHVPMLGGNVFRVEVTVIYADDGERSSRVYRVTVLPLESFDW